MKNSKPRKNQASWQITLFCLPFILLGLAALLVGFYPVGQHLRSLHWSPAAGHLLALDDVEGQQDIAESDVSRMEGSFSYEWQGRTLRSRQITFGLMRDNLDDGWREFVSERLGKPGQPITVWVNPAHPEEAVAIRDIRWIEVGLAFVGAFGFGAGGLALLWMNFRKHGPEKPAAERFSWPLVLGLLATSPVWLTLATLLWRDGRPVWALVSTLPVMVAVNGVRVGWLAYLARRKTRREIPR